MSLNKIGCRSWDSNMAILSQKPPLPLTVSTHLTQIQSSNDFLNIKMFYCKKRIKTREVLSTNQTMYSQMTSTFSHPHPPWNVEEEEIVLGLGRKSSSCKQVTEVSTILRHQETCLNQRLLEGNSKSCILGCQKVKNSNSARHTHVFVAKISMCFIWN